MVYLSINDKTSEGKRLLAELKKSRADTVHSRPDKTTRQALRDAKAGKVKKVDDVTSWLNKLAS